MMKSNDNKRKATAGGRMREDAKRDMPARAGAAAFASAMAIILFTIVPLLALAAVPPSRSAQENPRFVNLQVEIWPEFDRRGAALVMLKGELSAELTLPAAVSLRIPASSGGPSAVAFAPAAGAELLNLAYDRIDGDGFITLRFKAPQRFVHVEFYDPLATQNTERSYTYVWPGDAVVDRLVARVQEPAAASNVSVQPDLGAGAAAPDGLLYRTAELGAHATGKQLPFNIRYTKSNPQTSTEIFGTNASDSNPAAPAGSSPLFPGWVLGLAGAIGVSVAAVVGVLSWRRREKASGTRPGGAGFCSQCGNRLDSGGRFCSKCGAAVHQR